MGDNPAMIETLPGRMRFARFTLLGAMVFAAVFAAGCRRGTPPATPSGEGVVVTIFPLYDLVRQVAGPDIKVTLLVPPGVSEHGYSPSPADVKALNGAAILVANGGLDDWIASAHLDRAASGGQRLVHLMGLLGHDLGPFGGSEDGHDHAGDEHDHDECASNPHVWLVPANASKLVKRIADELTSLYPDKAEGISEREEKVQQQLAAIAVEYELALEAIADRRIITYHDAFNPLAEAYGLEVVATVMNMEMHDVTPARLQEVRRHIEQGGVRAVFIEPQYSSAAAQSLSNLVTLRLLDPLGDPNRAGYETYDAMMRSNLDNLVKGLRENVPPKGSGG